MSLIIQPLLSIVLGLILSFFGLFHSITRFPPPTVFSQLAIMLPTLGTVLFFALGVSGFVVGVLMLVLSARRLIRLECRQ